MNNGGQTTYRNVDEEWGDAVTVTVDDYRKQARAFGLDLASLYYRNGREVWGVV